MLLRIVRMEFKEPHTKEFLALFKKAAPVISSFEGCLKVNVFRDAEQINVVYTNSHWQSVEDLEKYRNSIFFQTTWEKAKKLFSGKPIAYSLVTVKEITDELMNTTP
ncbi:MAG: antibiotic biosynthesis monooxygenase [Flammeovirgaceae bacterium]|jgi:quinol monooxygenase YgiN|nr:antibiotic biosynthesis monooxygenase [Flammeovirgaceae bacterium]|tara:strand:- start:2675 stop:2995 length:321 start_codon:yes stop_codon:yes gene_type:complete